MTKDTPSVMEESRYTLGHGGFDSSMTEDTPSVMEDLTNLINRAVHVPAKPLLMQLKYVNPLNKSKLKLIQDAWESNIDSIDDFLEKLLLFLHLQPPLSKEESRLVGREVGNQSLSTTTICVLAIIKLSRLLLAKLVKLSKDKENISMLSNLSSQEFEIFLKMTTTFLESIKKLVCALCGNFIDDHVQDVLIIQKSLSQILSAPKIILDMVEYIFVPVVQPANQPESKLYYKTQFYYWNQVHQYITQHFTQA
ncbi:hypothetical protein PGT21_025996 [Puccinia graminis f. sp. tritici]|uniref:Uncharacterized protein n=1 Tax=Puccinia graminis f. sp. tritici TaxID=56615 RepID=A0A5B0LVE2_PUCGR|nr:hypothetical protein PGTUg99_017504 [Puccinia graminis f. sp. tritici]KAA1104524.1 hypothetical protein PGT21_025996 [Puccinia graminis f. sp. tritici]